MNRPSGRGENVRVSYIRHGDILKAILILSPRREPFSLFSSRNLCVTPPFCSNRNYSKISV